MIPTPCLFSAELCRDFGARETELDATLASAGPLGLRRDRYAFRSWLYDHEHQPLADAEAELDYWRSHIWRGFNALIEHNARIVEHKQREGELLPSSSNENLTDAITGLSYDLAVLDANHLFERGLTGNEGIRAFHDEVALRLKEVESAWKLGCERLALPLELTEQAARLFRRVADDLEYLLRKAPPLRTPSFVRPHEPGRRLGTLSRGGYSIQGIAEGAMALSHSSGGNVRPNSRSIKSSSETLTHIGMCRVKPGGFSVVRRAKVSSIRRNKR